MKKFITLMLVVMLVVGCVFTLTACGDNGETFYILAGAMPGWDVVAKEDAPDQLDTEACVVMEAAKANDARLASIADQLKGAKFIYVAEYTYDFNAPAATMAGSEAKAGWTAGPYALTEGGEALVYDGNATVKVIATAYTTEVIKGEDGEDDIEMSVWTKDWYSSAEHAATSLTPATLYIPPYVENGTYTNSGGWNDNPVLIGEAGTYLIVFARLADKTFAIGAIKVEAAA